MYGDPLYFIDLCNWKCYDERYPDLAVYNSDWELLRNHYFTSGKSEGR